MKTTDSNWVETWANGIEYCEDLGGVAWHDAPIPCRWHFCTPQTRAFLDTLGHLDRCSCGGIRSGGSRRWLFRNERRRTG